MKTNMKAIRTLRGFSQEELAGMLGVKLGTYRAWEQGRNEMGLDDAVAIANALGCTLDELAGRSQTISVEYHLAELPHD